MDVVGKECPQFSLRAVASDRVVTPEALRGSPAVLVFHGPRTTDAPKQVGKAVRTAHPLAEDVLVANVVNLRSMGGLWTKVAKAQMNSTYERMASKLTDVDPADYIILLPDWQDEVAPRFGFEDTNQRAGVAVLDREGTVLGATDEGDLAEQATAWLG